MSLTLIESHQLPKFSGHRHCGSSNNYLTLLSDLAKPGDQSVMWSNGKEPTKASYNPPNFGRCKHYGSEDIMIL